MSYDYTAILPPMKFETDGCFGNVSSTWRYFTGKNPCFECCCQQHDAEYHWGGSLCEKVAADFRFALCVVRTGTTASHDALFLWYWVIYSLIAVAMFIGVSVGGLSVWKKPYSWGFGWHPEWKE